MIQFVVRIFLLIIIMLPILGIDDTVAQNATLDDLQSLIHNLFPGNAEIIVEGAVTTLTDPVCLDVVPFPVASRYQLPQGYIRPEDRGPEAHPMFVNILVHDVSGKENIIPAEISMAIMEPNLDSEDVVPVMKNASSPQINIPRAGVRVEVVRGESLADVEAFNLDPTGDVLFKFEAQEKGLIEARLMAFDFTVENSNHQQMHVRGGIHDVIVPWHLTYSALPDERSSFVVLSGIAYGIAEPDTIQAQSRVIDEVVEYTIQLETMAVLKDAADSPPVPITINFTAIPDKNDVPYRGELTNFNITIDGVLMEDYTTALKRPLPMLWFVKEANVLSGDVRLAFGNGCEGYLQMDLLFRDIPFETVNE